MKEMKVLFTECMLATFLQVITFTSKGSWEASFLFTKRERDFKKVSYSQPFNLIAPTHHGSNVASY